MHHSSFLGRPFRSASMGSKHHVKRYRCFPSVECLEDRTVLTGGLLDPTFGANGQVLAGIGKPAAPGAPLPVRELVQIVNQPDGKLVIAYVDITSSSPQSVLRRFNEDGSPDFSFGDQSIVHTEGNYVIGLAVQTGGKLVAVGGMT